MCVCKYILCVSYGKCTMYVVHWFRRFIIVIIVVIMVILSCYMSCFPFIWFYFYESPRVFSIYFFASCYKKFISANTYTWSDASTHFSTSSGHIFKAFCTKDLIILYSGLDGKHFHPFSAPSPSLALFSSFHIIQYFMRYALLESLLLSIHLLDIYEAFYILKVV